MTSKHMQCPKCHRRWANDCSSGWYCIHCKNPNGTPLIGREVKLATVEVTNEYGTRVTEEFRQFKLDRIRENVARMARRRNER